METITNKTLEKLKYELVRDGIVSYETLEKAEELANVQRINIGQALINSGSLAEDTLLKFLETKLHIPYVNLEDYEPDTRCFKFVTFADARRYRIIPPSCRYSMSHVSVQAKTLRIREAIICIKAPNY